MPSDNRKYSLLLERADDLHRLSQTLRNILKEESGGWSDSIYCPAIKGEALGWEIGLYFLGYSTEWLAAWAGYRTLLSLSGVLEVPEDGDNDDHELVGIEQEIRVLRAELIRHPDLMALIISALQEGLSNRLEPSEVRHSAGAVLDQLLWLDEAEGIISSIDVERPGGQVPYGEKFWFLREQVQHQILKELERIPEDLQHAVLGSLSHYRHLRSQYSFTETNLSPSFLLTLSSQIHPKAMIQIQRESKNEQAGQIIREILNPFLRRLQEVTEGRSIRDMLDEYGEFEGIGGVVGGDSINIIPSLGGGVCCPLLVAISCRTSRVRRRPYIRDPWGNRPAPRSSDFSNTFKEIIKHLAMCSPGSKSPGVATQVVTLICDYWDQIEFDAEYYELLSIYHAQGIEFVFLIEGSSAGPSGLSEIKINFR